jgi:RecA-family ATPase
MNKNHKSSKGTGSSGIEYSPDTIRKMNKTKKRTEARWAKKSGKVTTRKIGEPAEQVERFIPNTGETFQKLVPKKYGH